MTETQLAWGKSGSYKLTILGTLRVDLTSNTIGSRSPNYYFAWLFFPPSFIYFLKGSLCRQMFDMWWEKELWSPSAKAGRFCIQKKSIHALDLMDKLDPLNVHSRPNLCSEREGIHWVASLDHVPAPAVKSVGRWTHLYHMGWRRTPTPQWANWWAVISCNLYIFHCTGVGDFVHLQ